MGIRETLNIPDELWEAFKAWTPTVGIDPAHDDWIKLRLEIYHFIKGCYQQYTFQSPVIEIGSWSLVPGADYSYFSEKYNFYRTNVSIGNGKAPLDFLLNAMDMKELGNESVGCLIATDILEHLPEPHSALRECYRVLINGGYLLITVPFYFQLHGDDYTRFCPQGLERVLHETGFDAVKISYNGDKPLNVQVVAQKKKTHSILLLGGGKACSHVEHMKKSFRVIITDTLSDAPTRKVADKFYLVDEFSSGNFEQQLLSIIEHEEISIVMPGIHQALLPLSELRDKITATGVKVLLPDDALTRACMDKQASDHLFESASLPTIPRISQENRVYPCYFKNRRGAGSKGVTLIKSEDQFRAMASESR